MKSGWQGPATSALPGTVKQPKPLAEMLAGSAAHCWPLAGGSQRRQRPRVPCSETSLPPPSTQKGTGGDGPRHVPRPAALGLFDPAGGRLKVTLATTCGQARPPAFVRAGTRWQAGPTCAWRTSGALGRHVRSCPAPERSPPAHTHEHCWLRKPRELRGRRSGLCARAAQRCGRCPADPAAVAPDLFSREGRCPREAAEPGDRWGPRAAAMLLGAAAMLLGTAARFQTVQPRIFRPQCADGPTAAGARWGLQLTSAGPGPSQEPRAARRCRPACPARALPEPEDRGHVVSVILGAPRPRSSKEHRDRGSSPPSRQGRKCRKHLAPIGKHLPKAMAGSAGSTREASARHSQGAWRAAERCVPEAPAWPAPPTTPGHTGAERAGLRPPHSSQLGPLGNPVTPL